MRVKEKINIHKERLTTKIAKGVYIEHLEHIKGNLIGTRICLKKLGEIEDAIERKEIVYLNDCEGCKAEQCDLCARSKKDYYEKK